MDEDRISEQLREMSEKIGHLMGSQERLVDNSQTLTSNLNLMHNYIDELRTNGCLTGVHNRRDIDALQKDVDKYRTMFFRATLGLIGLVFAGHGAAATPKLFELLKGIFT